MPIDVEVNMKIPSLTVTTAEHGERRIDNGPVRFTKQIVVEAIPKAGEVLQLSTRMGEPFGCTVTRSDWSEDKNQFIVSCSYAKRSITPQDHDALINDPDWTMKQLV
jgi:hypothetical protein